MTDSRAEGLFGGLGLYIVHVPALLQVALRQRDQSAAAALVYRRQLVIYL
jgi:hypothetical protein